MRYAQADISKRRLSVWLLAHMSQQWEQCHGSAIAPCSHVLTQPGNLPLRSGFCGAMDHWESLWISVQTIGEHCGMSNPQLQNNLMRLHR